MAFEFSTERTRLRPWRESDRAGLRRLVSDPQMMRYITGHVWEEPAIDAFFERQHNNMLRDGICMAALLDLHTDELIGVVGAQTLDVLGGRDVGWWIWRERWGQGLALEAAQAVVDHQRHHGYSGGITAVIDPQNQASIRVAQKMGMRYHSHCTADQTGSWRPPVPVNVYQLA